MELKQLIEKYQIEDKLLVYCLSVGLKSLLEEDEADLKEELMKMLSIDEETLVKILEELNEMSWKV